MTVVEHFRDAWHIRFHTLAPLNELNSDWWRQSGRQDGAAFDRPSHVAIIEMLAEQMAAHGLSDVLLAAADTNTVDEMVGNRGYYPPEVQARIGLLTDRTQGISQLAAENLRRIARDNSKKLWMTEFGAGPRAICPAVHAARAGSGAAHLPGYEAPQPLGPDRVGRIGKRRGEQA